MFPIEKTVRKRISVRTYDKRNVPVSMREEIMRFADALHNPLGPGITCKLLDKAADPKGEKLGTYGVIKGAELYIGALVEEDEHAMEALGYDFEHLVLYLTSLGLGTCWLGGTFNRSAFAEAMGVQEGQLFPIVSPIGFPAAKKSITEKIMRKGAKADDRLPWKQLFYRETFGAALSEEDAGDYASVLEMVRWAPSAVNRQPWRIVMNETGFHFYQADVSQDDKGSADMHRIDMGIAICHFHLAALEKGLAGRLERAEPADVGAPEKTVYIVSWIFD